MQIPGSGDLTHDSYIYSTFMFFVPMCFLRNLRGEGNEWGGKRLGCGGISAALSACVICI